MATDLSRLTLGKQTYNFLYSIAVDFDDTLFTEANHPQVGDAIPKNINFVQKCFDKGWFIIIHSCRASGQGWEVNQVAHRQGIIEMVHALGKESVPYHYIWGAVQKGGVWLPNEKDVGKPLTKYILDDDASNLTVIPGLWRRDQ
jgi:hypothetical protein